MVCLISAQFRTVSVACPMQPTELEDATLLARRADPSRTLSSPLPTFITINLQGILYLIIITRSAYNIPAPLGSQGAFLQAQDGLAGHGSYTSKQRKIRHANIGSVISPRTLRTTYL